jgi:hypothetical protein
MKTLQELQYRPKGFTLNMAHYVKRAKEVKIRFILNGNAKLKVHVDSTYELGYFFGATLSKGIANLSNHRGLVVYRLKDEDSTTLCKSVEESFNIVPKTRVIPFGFEVVVYSKPIARLVHEFGSGENRHLPEKFLVYNKAYLTGIKDGIEYFKGHIPDDRNILSPRKFSTHVLELYNLLTSIDS